MNEDVMSMRKQLKIIFVIAAVVIIMGTINTTIAASSPREESGRDLFIPSAEDVARDYANDPLVVRSRAVTINYAVLSAIEYVPADKPFQPQAINLNLFEDQVLPGVIERTDIDKYGNISWIGRIEGISNSDVTITLSEGVMVANAVFPGGFFRVRYGGNGNVHIVQEIDPSQFPPDHPPEFDQAIQSPAETLVEPQIPQADDGSVIDVMVVYTAAARSAAGGTASMNALIATAISETNTGYNNSNVTPDMNRVHSEEVSYTEADFSTDLSRLRGTSDGYMDNVHALRDTYNADAVVLLSNLSDYCGLGYLMDTVSSGFELWAFSVVYWNCATGYYSFGHEIGHNQGARHDWYIDPINNSPYSYNHGHVRWEDDWRTIMAYNTECVDRGTGDCTRINYWSNPNVLYAGNATGVVDGTNTTCSQYNLSNPECNAENWKTLNNTALIFSNFRIQGGDSYEPDDTSGQANWIYSGSQQTHSIVPVGDEDWVKFTLGALSGIVLETSGPSGDTRMWLYNSGLGEIEYDDDGGTNYFSKIDRLCGVDPLPAGTFYVKVDEFGDNDEIASYNIDLTITTCSTSAFTGCTNPGDQTDIPEAECLALVALYDNTAGASWNNNTGWKATDTPCSWQGVICFAGNVLDLILGVNNLVGSIPSELADLSRLDSLNLYTNSLTGSIPPQLGNLLNLERLDLSKNNLTGSIPTQLSDLPNLQYLYLYRNNLTGSIPPELSHLSKLRVLVIANNSLSGTIPPELGNLSSLSTLSLGNNSLTGNIPAALGNLSNLLTLSLPGNSLMGSIPTALANLSNLRYLILDNNGLTGSILADLGNLTNLEFLSLSSNSLTGNIPTALGDLINLWHLSLKNNNGLNGELPQSLTNITALYEFWFNGTGLCEPPNASFQTWLSGITTVVSSGLTCELLSNGSFESPMGAEWTQVNSGDAVDDRHFHAASYDGDYLYALKAVGVTEYIMQLFSAAGSSGDNFSLTSYFAGVNLASQGVMGHFVRVMNGASVVDTFACIFTRPGASFGWTQHTCNFSTTGTYDAIEVYIFILNIPSGIAVMDAVDLVQTGP